MNHFCTLLWPRYFKARVNSIDGVTHTKLAELMAAKATNEAAAKSADEGLDELPMQKLDPLFTPSLGAKGLINFVMVVQQILVPEEDRDAGVDSRWAMLVDEKWMSMGAAERIKLLKMLTGKRKGQPALKETAQAFIQEMTQLCKLDAFQQVHLHHMVLLAVLGGICAPDIAHRFFEELTVRCIISYLVAE
jgi:hypothetical protein